MKKNNRNIIISVITATLLLISTGCSQSAEVVNVIPDSTFVTTINTEAEASAATTVQTTAAQSTTAAQTTTAVTAIPVTEAQPVTVQTEAAPAPVIGATTKAAPIVTTTKTTTTTTTPKPKEPVQEDRSYLNLTPAEVQGILDECQKYAVSLGYIVKNRAEFEAECDELNKKCRQLRKEGISEEEIDKIWDEFEGVLRFFTDVSVEEFWCGGWHNIMYAGDFKKKYENVYMYNGYDSCSTKEDSIKHIINYLKMEINEEYKNERSLSVVGTKLKTFDEIIKDCDWGIMNGEDVRKQYATGDFIFDIYTSYAFSVSRW